MGDCEDYVGFFESEWVLRNCQMWNGSCWGEWMWNDSGSVHIKKCTFVDKTGRKYGVAS